MSPSIANCVSAPSAASARPGKGMVESVHAEQQGRSSRQRAVPVPQPHRMASALGRGLERRRGPIAQQGPVGEAHEQRAGSGARMNSHSWPMASQPANSAGPIERAGFTEVLVTGMLTRWIRVSARPIASGAKPLGARRVRDAEDDEQEDAGQHDLDDQAGEAGSSRPASGRRSRWWRSRTRWRRSRPAGGDDQQHGGRDDRGHHLGDHVGGDVLPREAPRRRQPQGDGGVEVAAGDVADGVRHRQHGEPEGEGDAEETDAQTSPLRNVAASTAVPHPVSTRTKVPRNSAVSRWTVGTGLDMGSSLERRIRGSVHPGVGRRAKTTAKRSGAQRGRDTRDGHRAE